MEQSARYKHALLKSIDREWLALFSVLDRFDPVQMQTAGADGWSPKDNLAHLSEWMKILMGYHIDKRPDHEVLGVSPEALGDGDFDKINELIYERNKTRPAAEVLAELKDTYAHLLGRLDKLTLVELMQPRHADDPQKRPLIFWVLGDTSEHFAEHRATLEKLI